MGMKGFSLILLALGLALASEIEDFDDYDDFGNSSNASSTAPPTHTTSHIPATTHSSNISNDTTPPTTHGTVTTQQHVTSAVTTQHVTPAPAGPVPTSVTVNDSDTKDHYCFRMSTNITVMIGNGTKTQSDREAILSEQPFVGNVSGKTFCSLKMTKAQIFLQDENVPGVVLGIILNATNTKKKQTWNIASLQFQVDDSYFSTVKDKSNRTFEYSGKNFNYSQDIGFERFFQCQHSFHVNFTTLANGSDSTDMYPSYFFENFKLQAFQFKNPTSGDFVNGVTCKAESSQGNKIVPIAVGAALAGLVVIVLIAYIIGRLRSRRHSYESLS